MMHVFHIVRDVLAVIGLLWVARQLHNNLADALERVRKADLEVEAHRREIARRPGS